MKAGRCCSQRELGWCGEMCCLSCLWEGPRPLPRPRLLCTDRDELRARSGTQGKRFQQWQQLLLPRLRFPEDPKAFPIIFALFQKPLSRCPSSHHARAAVHLATHSPEPARAGTSAPKAGGLCTPPKPTALTDWVVRGSGETAQHMQFHPQNVKPSTLEPLHLKKKKKE